MRKREEELAKKGKKEEEILDPTAYFENRSAMVHELKKSPETYPYPHKFNVKLTVGQFINTYLETSKKGEFFE